MVNTGYPVTSRLFWQGCPFEHVYAATTEEALGQYLDGKTVVVPTLDIAFSVMTRVGIPMKTAYERIALVKKMRAWSTRSGS